MLSIVFGHFAGHGIFHKDNSVIQTLDLAVSYAVWAFAFISGWYSIRFGLWRFFKFVCLGLFYSGFVGMLTPILLGRWHFEFSLGWFGNSYLGLMLLAPFLNAGVDWMRRESPRNLLLLWLVYAGLMFVSWLPLPMAGVCFAPSGWGSASVNTLVFFYLTGRIFSQSERIRVMPQWMWVVVFVLSDMGYVGWSVCGHFFRGNGTFFGRLLNSHASYMNPFIVCASIAIFFVFLKLPSSINRHLGLVSFLAPSMFSVYLIHEGCNRQVSLWLYSSLETTLRPYVGTGTFTAIANIVLSTLIVFASCTAIDLIRRLALCHIKAKRIA